MLCEGGLALSDSLQKNIERARQMERLLRLTTLPVGIRLWKNGEASPPDAGERPARNHSWRQFLPMARIYAADIRPPFLVKAEPFSCRIGPGLLASMRPAATPIPTATSTDA